ALATPLHPGRPAASGLAPARAGGVRRSPAAGAGGHARRSPTPATTGAGDGQGPDGARATGRPSHAGDRGWCRARGSGRAGTGLTGGTDFGAGAAYRGCGGRDPATALLLFWGRKDLAVVPLARFALGRAEARFRGRLEHDIPVVTRGIAPGIHHVR